MLDDESKVEQEKIFCDLHISEGLLAGIEVLGWRFRFRTGFGGGFEGRCKEKDWVARCTGTFVIFNEVWVWKLKL